MRYDYISEDKKEILEVEFSIHDDLPKTIEKDGKTFTRHWGGFNTAIHIPFQWGESRPSNFKKSPSGKKHFY
jgi:hypothetical protein